MNTRRPIVAQIQSPRALGTNGARLSNSDPHLPQPYIRGRMHEAKGTRWQGPARTVDRSCTLETSIAQRLFGNIHGVKL
jgi:hypothetical protein